MSEEYRDEEGAGHPQGGDLGDCRADEHDALEDHVDAEESAHERHDHAGQDSVLEDWQRVEEGHPVPLDEEEAGQDRHRSHEVHGYAFSFVSVDPCAKRNRRPANECTSTLT